ncbi:MAG: O-antigen ligase family protein [Pseudomonadota bacterium]
MFLGVAVLLGAWLLLFMTGRIRVAPQFWLRLRWPLVMLVLVQLWVFLQTLPLPRSWVMALSPHAAGLHLPAERIPLSLDAEITRFHLLQGLTYTFGFFLCAMLVNQRERIEKLLWTLVLSGAFQSIYGSLMVLSGIEYGFFVEKYVGQGLATGTFVNRNHFAGYLVMSLAAGIGLLVSRLGGDRPTSTRERLRAWVALLLSTKFLLRLLLAVMVIGLVLSRSRMGNLSFFVSLSIAGGILLASSGRGVSGRVGFLLTSLLLVDLFIVGRWFGAEEVAERLLETSTATESRDEVSVFSLDILRDYPLTGSGGGTFYTVFPHYSQVVLQGDYYVHAHNDYLELAGDLGIPAFLLLAGFVLGTLSQAFFKQHQNAGKLQKGVGFTVLMTVVWLAIHSAADFNLYVPANAFTCMVLLALAWGDKGYARGKTGEIPGSYVNG